MVSIKVDEARFLSSGATRQCRFGIGQLKDPTTFALVKMAQP